MIIRLLFHCLLFNFYICSAYADEVIWKGVVQSNGTPTELITLKNRDEYQIRVSGYINLGKWIQAAQKLANDACYEFSGSLPPKKFESLKNSHNISVCDGQYHEDHVYTSKPFVAKQNKIFLWVYDTDYEDNSGSLNVEIIHKSKN